MPFALPRYDHAPARATADGVERPPILMVHGIHDSGASFANYMAFFSEEGFDCYAIHQRGHGAGADLNDLIGASMDDYIADTRALHAHIGRAIIIGASMGGLLAQKIAECDDPHAVILLAPAPPGDVSFFPGWRVLWDFKGIIRPIVTRPTYMQSWATARKYVLNALPEDEARAQFARTQPESSRVMRDQAFGRVRVDASRVTCPMLVVVGENDPGLPPRVQQKIAAKYGAELWIVPNHSHQLTEERWWRDTAGRLREWMHAKVVQDLR